MDRIRMADVIPLLPIPLPSGGKSSYYVSCPHCDGRGRKKDRHLNINFAKNVFRCALCGCSGGIFDLYALYTGVPRDKARNEILRALRKDVLDSDKNPKTKIPAPVVPQITDSPAADIDIRHAVYSSLLSMLTLAPDHRASLLDRGLSESAVIENGYRTTPLVGGRAIAKRIIDSGLQAEGVPGFYRDKTGAWTFIAQKRGILVPVRDIFGRVQGLQIRRDNVEKRKYRWVSSAEIDGGCGAESWLHLAGPVGERIILIEGPMKADIVYHLTGQTVLAVPGVNSLKYLERVLLELIERGLRHVMTAFDMDFLKNPHVQNGYDELVNLLGQLGLRFGTYLWRPEYNGLDDYIREFCMDNRRA